MEKSISDAEIANDVLHNQDHSKLSQEEIAKALAHHNKRHHPEPDQKAPPGKKQERPK